MRRHQMMLIPLVRLSPSLLFEIVLAFGVRLYSSGYKTIAGDKNPTTGFIPQY
jgi:hypothetical protein